MIEKYIQLLQEQIEKLNEKNFDLKSWKTSTVLVIDRIFGENSKKADEINSISFDLSSWNLRDTLAKQSNMDSCKQKGKAILETSISEIKLLGIPESADKNKTIPSEIFITAIKDELKGNQYKEIAEIINSRNKPSDKKTMIIDKLKSYGPEVSDLILAEILSNNEFRNKLS